MIVIVKTRVEKWHFYIENDSILNIVAFSWQHRNYDNSAQMNTPVHNKNPVKNEI